MKTAFIVLLFASAILAQNHILITEVVVTPTDGEFIEIYNNTSGTIDLSDYYLTDATYANGGNYYYNIVTGSNAGGGSNSDFHARFPDGSSIASGAYQTIGIKGSGFVSTYGKNPTYELYETNASIQNMREAFSGSIDGGSTLTNSGEVVILYFWDGLTDLVSDGDYYLWGDKDEAVDKTGVSIDGPDDGSTTSTYLADTPIASQIVSVNGQPHEFGESSQRTTLIETGETQSGGNGLTGHNEMSENLASSFIAAAPNPGSGPGGSSSPSITNIIRTPQEPGPSDFVAISAQITDDGTITSAQLFSSINDGLYSNTAMTNTGGDTYEAQIDSQSIGTVVKYYIRAEDNDAEVTQTDTMSYTVSSGSGITPIADIQNDPSYIGKQVIIQGVVTIGAGVVATDWTKAYVQDNSGRGINIYKSGTPVDPDLVRGNMVKITGQVDEYSGITEIVNYTVEVLATNQPLPTAIQLTTSAANDLTYEGTYINVKGIIEDKYVAGAGTTMDVDDGSGPVPIRVWDTAGINLNAYSTGDTVSVNGVMDIYQSAAQTLLGYQEDIEKSTLGPGDEDLSITNVQHTPAVPTSSDPVTVIADVIAKSTVTKVQLFTSFNSSAFDSMDMVLLGNDTYQAMIDSQSTGTLVNYYIRAEDDQGNSEVSGTQSYTVTAPVEITPIAEIRSNPEYIGQQVTIEGVVTIGSGILTTSWTDTYVQDESERGINVYRGGTPVDPLLKRGNLVRVAGEVALYLGILEIENYTVTVLANNQPLPEAIVITTDEATGVFWEGTFVKVKGVILELYSAGGGTNIVIDDGSGPVTIRAWDTAGLDFSEYAVGDNLEVKGVVDIYLDAGQVLLAYQEDISFTEIAKSPLLLKVPNKPFVPDQGETLPIIYSAGTENAHVTLRIYDMAGRLIATPVDEIGRSFEQTFEWDGTDQVNEQVTLGAYILILEVVSNSDGSNKRKTAPIVVGTILK